MKEKNKKILHWPWLKIFVVCAILFYLLIQWGNFHIRRIEEYIWCADKFTQGVYDDEKEKEIIQHCKRNYSIRHLFFGLEIFRQ